MKEKAPFLVQDLVKCGVANSDFANMSLCSNLPQLTCGAYAFGCAYVMEEATLRGQVILKALEQHLGVSATEKGSFFITVQE